LSENVNGRHLFGDLGIDGRIIVNWTVNKYEWKMWTGFMWLRIGGKVNTVMSLGVIHDNVLHYHLSNYRLL
jgi:hypothetical protein